MVQFTVPVEKMIDVTSYNRVEKKATRQVTTNQAVWSEKEIDVQKCVPVTKTATRTVQFTVPVEKMVDVTSYRTVEKIGTRVVQKPVQVEEIVKQTFTKVVPYETIVKVPVPVAAPSCAPCETPCAPTGMSGGCGASTSRTRGGLFSRMGSGGGLFSRMGRSSSSCSTCN
jgi:hypothetical protein